MTQLNLPSSTIKKIVDDPTLLGVRLTGGMNETSNALDPLGISPSAADHILAGYNNGFRAVFIMNATLAAVATVVSILMIHHKNLERDDEAQLRAQAKKEEKHDKEETVLHAAHDIEMGALQGNNDSSCPNDKV